MGMGNYLSPHKKVGMTVHGLIGKEPNEGSQQQKNYRIDIPLFQLNKQYSSFNCNGIVVRNVPTPAFLAKLMKMCWLSKIQTVFKIQGSFTK